MLGRSAKKNGWWLNVQRPSDLHDPQVPKDKGLTSHSISGPARLNFTFRKSVRTKTLGDESRRVEGNKNNMFILGVENIDMILFIYIYLSICFIDVCDSEHLR